MIEKYIAISTITILSLLSVIAISSFSIANGQPEVPLPVLLVHGYMNTNEVWEEWEKKLIADGIYPKPVTFNTNDECGSVQDHAAELNQIVEDFKIETGSEKINIVAHSKGGLDVRWYLANDPSNDDVANLIMIGTPNAGSPRATEAIEEGTICEPAIYDLVPNAPATRVGKNPNTQYHTIAGNWVSEFIPFTIIDMNCPEDAFSYSYLDEGRDNIQGPDDGMVPLLSVQSGVFHSVGVTNNCHTNLFSDEEYDKAIPILNSTV